MEEGSVEQNLHDTACFTVWKRNENAPAVPVPLDADAVTLLRPTPSRPWLLQLMLTLFDGPQLLFEFVQVWLRPEAALELPKWNSKSTAADSVRRNFKNEIVMVNVIGLELRMI